MSAQVTNTGQMSQQRVLPLRVTAPRHGADREGGVVRGVVHLRR